MALKKRRVYIKKRLLIAATLSSILLLSGCNRTLVDTTYKFDSAIVSLNGEKVIEGNIQNWKDYDNSDQIQVTINGVTYLTHSSNVILIAK